ncbi:MAG: L-2-hydroxyglutarate oxidase [Myxococcales bacterium]|nr:L-2-hydroxyglutarate oxidase [Myxococcales bacterium]
MITADLVVVGGGVVGLTTALTVAHDHPDQRVVVLEKEPMVGAHASGRNSGVLHAGFYYSADSLKAAFSVQGNQAWRRFCSEHDVPVHATGKLVVAKTEAEHAGLTELLARADANGVRMERISEAQAREIEPRVRTTGWALFSPDTATVDPGQCMAALAEACRRAGVEIRTSTRWLGRLPEGVQTSAGPVHAPRVLNAAGLHADRVASAWGCGEAWQLVPFRGAYLVGSEQAAPLACCIYPVPDLGMPFLGVHLTPKPSGQVTIGPTAVPARWREDYGGWGGFRAGEALGQAAAQLRLLATRPEIRRHAVSAIGSLWRSTLVRRASALVDGLQPAHFARWGRPGIRSQLVSRRTGALHMDFVVEQGEGSLHVLNAVSPAFTCAFPFARMLARRLQEMP